jgi:hypothetical protein
MRKRGASQYEASLLHAATGAEFGVSMRCECEPPRELTSPSIPQPSVATDKHRQHKAHSSGAWHGVVIAPPSTVGPSSVVLARSSCVSLTDRVGER